MELVIARRLFSSESLFKWKPHDDVEKIPVDLIEKLIGKLKEKEFDSSFQFEEIAIYILLSYEYHSAGKLNEAIEIIKNGEVKLNHLKDDVIENEMYDAILHVFKATKAILLMKDHYEEAIKIGAEIPDEDSIIAIF